MFSTGIPVFSEMIPFAASKTPREMPRLSTSTKTNLVLPSSRTRHLAYNSSCMCVASGEFQPPTIGSSRGGVILLAAAPALNFRTTAVSPVARVFLGNFLIEPLAPVIAKHKMAIANGLILIVTTLGRCFLITSGSIMSNSDFPFAFINSTPSCCRTPFYLNNLDDVQSIVGGCKIAMATPARFCVVSSKRNNSDNFERSSHTNTIISDYQQDR